MRVDDPSALPLAPTATPNPNDKVLGVDFSGGMASILAQINAALGSTGLQFSNTGGTTLRGSRKFRGKRLLSARACSRFALWPGECSQICNVSSQLLVPAAMFSAAITVPTP